MKMILGFLWALPVSILGWVGFGLLYLFGQIEKVERGKGYTIVWDIEEEGWFAQTFLIKTDKDWAGYSCGCNILVLDSDTERWERTIRHEYAHCIHQYVLGIFFLPAWLLNSAWIAMFQDDKHWYLDNWFEKNARAAAGQPKRIPKYVWYSMRKLSWW